MGGHTKKIRNGFPGYPFNSVDAVMVPGAGEGKAYMFSGDSYFKWDLRTDAPSEGWENGYTKKITYGFQGYPFNSVDAVMVFSPGVTLGFLSSSRPMQFAALQPAAAAACGAVAAALAIVAASRAKGRVIRNPEPLLG